MNFENKQFKTRSKKFIRRIPIFCNIKKEDILILEKGKKKFVFEGQTIDHSREIKLGEKYKQLTQMLSQTVDLRLHKKKKKREIISHIL